jgi:hypothetical protein
MARTVMAIEVVLDAEYNQESDFTEAGFDVILTLTRHPRVADVTIIDVTGEGE